MTLSERDQSANLNLAFQLTMRELGEAAVVRMFFDPSSPVFEAILPTTWKEMCDQGWLEASDLYRRPHYRMTAKGWIEGLWRTDAAKNPALRERLGRLAAVLKGHVKDRNADIVVELTSIVDESGLPPGWVFNAIEGSLIEKLHGTRGASWADTDVTVLIPVNFGIALVDHTVDIREQLEVAQQELATAREELGEYRCPVCQAPMTSQNYNVPLSEDVDGFLVSYACGRIDTDGYGSQPCPSYSKYPTLGDYELQLKENPTEPSLKWTCLAVARTPMARQVSILPGHGRTADEARDRVIECYNEKAKRWR